MMTLQFELLKYMPSPSCRCLKGKTIQLQIEVFMLELRVQIRQLEKDHVGGADTVYTLQSSNTTDASITVVGSNRTCRDWSISAFNSASLFARSACISLLSSTCLDIVLLEM